MNPRPDGAVQSPALSGLIPSTSCKYWAMKRNVPNATKNPTMLIARDALKATDLNNDRSMSGSASAFCLCTNTTPMTTPTIMTATETHTRPPSAIRLIPEITARAATRDNAALIGSRRPGFGSRYSGRSRGPTASNSSMTGTLMRNTEPHPEVLEQQPAE
jgi:hypothetical protein